MYSKDKSYQKAYKIFRERLVEARRTAGLTQGEVSMRMKRARTYISKCEIGERRVDFVELVRLARIYRKSLDFFVVE
jgi:transcriptional regulator with XRE-family HTH domain